VAGAAGGVDDGELEERSGGVLRVGRDGALDDGLEGAVEQDLNEAVGGVVAAAGLAGVALGLAAGEEGELAAPLLDLRDELEEALVDAAELLGAHVAPVHAGEAGGLAQPREAEHGE